MFCSLKLTRRLVVVSAVFLICVAILGVIGVKTGVAVATSGEQQEGVTLPIIMYHSLLKDSSQQGKYVVSPEVLENDLKYLKTHGYTGINMQQLLDYVTQGTPLPEKPILITFDDGYYNNYLYAFPLAEQYEFKMMISPIGYYSDQYSETEDENAYYSHLTWDQVKEMLDSGFIEVQNHTYNLHSSKGGRLGARKLKTESEAAYQEMLRKDLSQMQDRMTEKTGYTPTTFVYPFGAVSEAALPVIKSLGFQATLTCESKLNTITGDPECLFGLGRYLRPAGTSSAKFFSSILPD